MKSSMIIAVALLAGVTLAKEQRSLRANAYEHMFADMRDDGECKMEVTKQEFKGWEAARIAKFGGPGKKGTKTAIFMVGGPGAGKSVAQGKCLEAMGKKVEDFIVVDPDKVLSDLFKKDNSCYWDDEAVRKGFLDVKDANNQFWQDCMKKEFDIVFDTTGRAAGFAKGVVFPGFRKKGYKVVVCGVVVDPEVAKERVLARQKKEEAQGGKGRAVDMDYLLATYKTIKEEAIPAYKEMVKAGLVDEIHLYDNNGDTMVPLKAKVGNKL